MTTDALHMTPRPLLRSTTDKRLGGVSGGLGHYFHVDPVLFRIGFAVATLAGGAGLLAYLALWVFVPRDDRPPVSATLPPVAA